jgi:formiminotetrahydrofolate cyclodeaminase
MDFAKNLAKKIRTSGGGLPSLRAKEIFLESKNQVQISTVLTNYSETSISAVLNAIKTEIAGKNIEITDTELIGLTAQKPLIDYSIDNLKVSSFNYENQILENKIMKLLSNWQMGANFVIEAMSNTEPTPGGGSAAAISGAMGCALAQMAMGITIKAKKTPEEVKKEFSELISKIDSLKIELQNCIAEDSSSFEKFMQALKIPKEKEERKIEMQKALIYAARVPLKTATLCYDAISILRPISEKIKKDVGSDYKSAIYLLNAAIKCALENVYINTESIEDIKVKQELVNKAEELNGVVSKF